MRKESLYHISEDPKIKIFEPLAAPFHTSLAGQNVVWAINERMLHNYLLPRNCPRVTFYTGPATSERDRKKFFGTSSAEFIISVESGWLSPIQRATLYCYEFSPAGFTLFDECAGYYISREPVIPLSAKPIYNLVEEMLKRNVELRFMPSIAELGEEVKKSTLNFSLIRMKNIQEEVMIGERVKKINGYNRNHY
jgi:hypothetical protein